MDEGGDTFRVVTEVDEVGERHVWVEHLSTDMMGGECWNLLDPPPAGRLSDERLTYVALKDAVFALSRGAP